jgi:hypothetical protein
MPSAPFFVNNGPVRAAGDTGGFAAAVFQAEFAFQHGVVVGQHQAAVRAHGNAGSAANALILIDFDDAVFHGQCAGDAPFDTKGFFAVTAVDSKMNVIAVFDPNPGQRALFPVISFNHAGFARIGKSAVKFTQMAAEAPFFIDINAFQCRSPLILRRA